MKKALVLFIITCISFTVFSQVKDSTSRFSFNVGLFNYGYQEFNNLNNKLAGNNSYEQLRNSTGGISLGWNAVESNAVIDFSFGIYSSLSGNANKKSTNLSIGGFSVSGGYNFSKNKFLLAYPFIGLGYESVRVKLNKDLSSYSFDSLLQSNTSQQKIQSVILSNSFFTWQAGMGFEFINKKNTKKSIGLKIGYEGGFGNRDWRVNQTQQLSGSPADGFSKFFASLILKASPSKKKS